jgi:hypothetical protein
MVGPARDTGQSITLPRRTSPDLAAGLAPTPDESNDPLIEHDRAGSQPRVGSGGGDQQSHVRGFICPAMPTLSASSVSTVATCRAELGAARRGGEPANVRSVDRH